MTDDRMALIELIEKDADTDYTQKLTQVATNAASSLRSAMQDATQARNGNLGLSTAQTQLSALGWGPAAQHFRHMRTAVDRVGVGKIRQVNARFAAMASHYLFEPMFSSPGVVRLASVVGSWQPTRDGGTQSFSRFPLPSRGDPARRERGVSLGAMSKAYGLPGLRLGWVACRDATFIARLATMRQYLSTCDAGPVEVLASIALRAAPTILARNRAITDANLASLQSFLDRHHNLFECHPPEGGMVCYPRYKGAEGVERFVEHAAALASVLLLPSSVFRSDLLPLPTDRLRIGFGRAGFAAGLDALDAFLGRS